MAAPSYEERICAMFDSFCKTVSRNCVRNLKRAENNRNKHFANEPAEYLFELLKYRDKYSSDFYELYVAGYPCVIESEALYQALKSLPDKQRQVLLLDFWRGLSDEEISEYLEVTTRTVYNLRQRAFKTIRKFYGKQKDIY